MPRKKETRGGWNRKYKTEKQRKEAVQRQTNESHKRLMTAFAFRFHNVNDQAVIDKLNSVPNKVDYIRQLILKDIQQE